MKKTVFALTCLMLAALFAACVVSPFSGVAAVPVMCVLAYMLSVFAGVAPVAAASAAFGVAAFFVHSGKALYVAAAALFAAVAAVRCFRRKLAVWGEIAFCSAAGLIAVCAVTGLWALCTRCSVSDVITSAVQSLSRDPVAFWLAKRNYGSLTAEFLGHAPLTVHDELYAAEVMLEFANFAGRELQGYTLWYVTGFGAFAAGAGCAGGLAAAQVMGAKNVVPPVKELRLSHSYLFAAVLPALAFALLSFYEPMAPVTRTVMNLMITLPCALCGITLLYHSLVRVRGKPKIAAIAGFWIITAVAALFWEYGLAVFCFVGLADCVINVRKLLDWALS